MFECGWLARNLNIRMLGGAWDRKRGEAAYRPMSNIRAALVPQMDSWCVQAAAKTGGSAGRASFPLAGIMVWLAQAYDIPSSARRIDTPMTSHETPILSYH